MLSNFIIRFHFDLITNPSLGLLEDPLMIMKGICQECSQESIEILDTFCKACQTSTIIFSSRSLGNMKKM